MERTDIQNPYSQENRATYKKGALENMFSNLGFRTQYDNYMMDMDNRAAEWETQNQSLAYEEQYNSAEAAADRMRAAGINPDLQGIQNAGEAAEMAEPELPNTSGMNEMETAGEGAAKLGMFLLGMLTDGASNVINGVGKLYDIMGKGEELEQKQTTTDTNNLKLSEQFLKFIPELQRYYNEINPDAQPGEIAASVKTTSAEKFWSRSLGMSRRNTKRLLDTYSYILETTPSRLARETDKTDLKKIRYEGWLTDKTQKIQEITLNSAVKRAEIDQKYITAEAELYAKYPNIPKDIIQGQKSLEMAQNTAGINMASAKTAAAAYQKLQSQKLKEIAEHDYNEIKKYEEEFNKDFSWYRINPNNWANYRRAYQRQFGGRADNIGLLEDDAETVGKFISKR